MNSKVKKVFHVIIDVLVILILIISVFVLIGALTSRANGGVPNIFGKSPIGVLTNSMHGDNQDSFDEGDLIICDKVENAGKDDFKVGDVVTFAQDITGNGTPSLVTHRIYKVNEDGTFQTKGDNNDTYDQDKHNSIVFPDLHNYDILAQYHGTKIPGLGGVINFLQTPTGFFWVILFPMILFFLYQAVRVIMNAMAYSKAKGEEKARQAIEEAGLTEEQKAQAIAEYLASQKQNSGSDATPEPEDVPKTPESSEPSPEDVPATPEGEDKPSE
ncbi:MAG: signal peptidase I [Ruminococcus sp.]|nr:signal peptidase I [Ruminococcus sp.]